VRIPPLPASSQWSQIVREVRVSIAPLPACSQQSKRSTAPSEARSTATSEDRSTATSEDRSTANSWLPAKPDCQRGESENSTATSLHLAKPDPLLPVKPVSPLPVKPDPLLPAKPDCQRWEWSLHGYQLPPSEVRSTATSKASFTPNCKAGSTATSLLPAKPDPPLPPCSQRGQIVREVRVSMSEQRACQSIQKKHIGGLKVNMLELCDQADQWWKWTYQSWSGSEYVRVRMSVVRMSLLESWEWECTLVRVVNKLVALEFIV